MRANGHITLKKTAGLLQDNNGTINIVMNKYIKLFQLTC